MMRHIEEKIILESILRYAIPRPKNKSRKHGRLEEILEKPKIKPLERFLDDLLNPKKTAESIKKFEMLDLGKGEEAKKETGIRFFGSYARKKENADSSRYSIEIRYESNEDEERFRIIARPINPGKPTKDAKQYSFSREKEAGSKENCSVSLVYENDYGEERLNVSYRSTIGAYLNRRQNALHNFEDRVPGKHVDVLPANLMGSVLGFTYLGQDRMALREGLIRDKKMVDIHESIHTPDEYETRVLTSWIMQKARPKYLR